VDGDAGETGRGEDADGGERGDLLGGVQLEHDSLLLV
jgi:hypothetical protein